jgi:hypothetical protein
MDPEKTKFNYNYGRAGVADEFSQENKFSWQDVCHGQDLNDIFGDLSGSEFGNLFVLWRW